MDNDEPQQGPAGLSEDRSGSRTPIIPSDVDATGDRMSAREQAGVQSWACLFSILYRIPLVRRALEYRLTEAYSLAARRDSAGEDAVVNAGMRLPVDEQLRVPVIWLAELFTPTTVGGLLNGLRELTEKSKAIWSGLDDPVEWVRASRRQREGAWRYLPEVWPDTDKMSEAMIVKDTVPPGVANVQLSLHTLTPTVTVLIAGFWLQDERAQELESILRKDFASSAERLRHGVFRILDAEEQKSRAVSQWRAVVRQDAEDWLARRFSGTFRQVAPGRFPAIELVVTQNIGPWQVPAPSSSCGHIPSWAEIIGFDPWSDHWLCASIRGLRLKEFLTTRLNPIIPTRLPMKEAHPLIFAVIKNELIADTSVEADSTSPFRDAVSVLAPLASGLLAHWSLTVLLQELEEQISIIQDAATYAGRKHSTRALSRVQEQLLRAGLDSRIVVNDVVRYSQHPMWAYGVSDFLEESSSRSSAEKTALRSSLLEWLKQHQETDGRRVSEMEADLHEVLSTSADLAAAGANLRLQRTAIWVAIVSAVAAVVAVVITLRS